MILSGNKSMCKILSIRCSILVSTNPISLARCKKKENSGNENLPIRSGLNMFLDRLL